MTDIATIELWLLDGVYKLGCPSHKQDDLKNAGEILEKKFREMRGQNPRMDNQKIAVMVSLQLMQECLDLNKSLQTYSQCDHLLADMIDDVDQQVKQITNQV